GQLLLEDRALALFEDAILRVHDLDADRTGPHVPVTADDGAGTKLGLLLPREVKGSQRQLAGAIADAYQQAPAAAIYRLGEQYLAAGQAAHPRLERSRPDEFRTVLVTQRQEKQQV